jgi:hypothetical protein
MSKELCDCGKNATWIYMPGYPEGDNPYSCDDCVPRRCSCIHNYLEMDPEHLPEGIEGKDWKWVEPGVWTYIDEQGREYPCAEYNYSEDGFDIE